MPRIPEYQKRYQTQPLPGARYRAGADARSFGAGQAADIGRLGQAARAWSEFFEQEQLVTDRAELRDTLNQARTHIREQQSELYSRKGADAINVYEQAEKDFRVIGQRLVQGLKTDEQKEAFATRYGNLVNRALDRTLSFQTQSREQYDIDTRLAHIQNDKEDAVANHNNPEIIKENEAYTRAEVRALNKGQSEAVIKKAVDAAVNGYYAAILGAKLATSPEDALAFFKANREKFRPSGRAALEEGLQQQADRQWIRDKAIEISSSGKSLEQKLAMVDDIADSKRADAVRARVKMRHAEQEKIKEDQYQAFVDEEFDNMRSATDRGEEYQIPYGRLRREHEVFFEKYQSRRLMGDPKEVDRYTSAFLKHELLSLPDDKLLEEDLKKHENQLTVKDLEVLLAAQRDLKKGTGDDQLNRIRSEAAQVNAYLDGLPGFQLERKDGALTKKGRLAKKRWGWAYIELAKRLRGVPKNKRTEERIAEELARMFQKPLSYDPWGLGDYVFFRYELPYLARDVSESDEFHNLDQESAKKIAEKYPPENIQGEFQVDMDRGVYYEPTADENRRIVKDLSGRLIDVEDYK